MLHRRTVGDVMTEEVVTLRPNTPFQEVAALLDANDIVAAPVVDDDGAPVGVVSASDVRRHETGMPDPQGKDGDDERVWGKARARTAGALMSSPVFTRVASTVPSAVEAGPVFPLRGGLVCQRMTQTIKIDGQSVHASALLCRHPNGVWKIAVPPDAVDAAKRGTAPSAGPPRPDTKTAARARPSPGSPVAKAE